MSTPLERVLVMVLKLVEVVYGVQPGCSVLEVRVGVLVLPVPAGVGVGVLWAGSTSVVEPAGVGESGVGESGIGESGVGESGVEDGAVGVVGGAVVGGVKVGIGEVGGGTVEEEVGVEDSVKVLEVDVDEPVVGVETESLPSPPFGVGKSVGFQSTDSVDHTRIAEPLTGVNEGVGSPGRLREGIIARNTRRRRMPVGRQN